jgi:hypothetical protein
MCAYHSIQILRMHICTDCMYCINAGRIFTASLAKRHHRRGAYHTLTPRLHGDAFWPKKVLPRLRPGADQSTKGRDRPFSRMRRTFALGGIQETPSMEASWGLQVQLATRQLADNTCRWYFPVRFRIDFHGHQISA